MDEKSDTPEVVSPPAEIEVEVELEVRDDPQTQDTPLLKVQPDHQKLQETDLVETLVEQASTIIAAVAASEVASAVVSSVIGETVATPLAVVASVSMASLDPETAVQAATAVASAAATSLVNSAVSSTQSVLSASPSVQVVANDSAAAAVAAATTIAEQGSSMLYTLAIGVPYFFFSTLTYTISYTVTFTFTFPTLVTVFLSLSLGIWFLIRYRYLTKYSRLPEPPTPAKHAGVPFDLHPDAAVDDTHDRAQGYPDEFMSAFLSSIKVFGYLDRPVFHELARHLQTRKLKAGEILFNADDDDRDFYVVVDGTVQLFIKSDHVRGGVHGDVIGHSRSGSGLGGRRRRGVLDDSFGLGEDDDDDEDDDYGSESDGTDLPEEREVRQWHGHHLLNEVHSGGTVSSLFSILSVFTEDFDLPGTKYDDNDSHKGGIAGDHDDDTPHASVVEASETDSRRHTVGSFLGIRRESDSTVTQVFPNLRRSESVGPTSSTSTPTIAIEESVTEAPKNSETSSFSMSSSSVDPTTKEAISAGAEDNADSSLPSERTSVVPPSITIPNSSSSKGGFHTAPVADAGTFSSFMTQNLEARRRPRPRSVHPHIVARAAVDTTLAVIPAEAFKKLTEKFPNAVAHIVQVILTRFQRVTFNTLYRYLGLSKELLKIEKRVNEIAAPHGLPRDFFATYGGVDRLRKANYPRSSKMEEGSVGSGRTSRGVPQRHHSKPSLSSSSKRMFRKDEQYEGDVEDSERESVSTTPVEAPAALSAPDTPSTTSPSPVSAAAAANLSSPVSQQQQTAPSIKTSSYTTSPFNSLASELDEEEMYKLRESCFECISQLIGMRRTGDDPFASPRPAPGSPGPAVAASQQAFRMPPTFPADFTFTTPPYRRLNERRLSIDSTTTTDDEGSMSDRPPPMPLYSSSRRGTASSTTSSSATPSSSTSSMFGGANTASTSSLFAGGNWGGVGWSSASSDPIQDIEILTLDRGRTLVREGDRVEGLYFVIDGLLEASMRARTDEMAAGGSYAAPASVSGGGVSKSSVGVGLGSSAGLAGSSSGLGGGKKSRSGSMHKHHHHRGQANPPLHQRVLGRAVFSGLDAAAGTVTEEEETDVDGGTAKGPQQQRTWRRRLFLIKPGGLAGYLAALTSHPSFVTIRAKTPSTLAFLPKPALEKYLERSPSILLTLAKRLINQLSSLVLHIDVALEWGQINAGQVLCRQGEAADCIYIVLNGRLRSIMEYGPGTGADADTGVVGAGAQNGKAGDPASKGEKSGTPGSLKNVPINGKDSPKGGKYGSVGMGYPRTGGAGGMGAEKAAASGSFGGNKKDGPHFKILGEHGRGESVGELEVLTNARRPGTVHAIRDTEVAILPRFLFNALAVRHPAITIQISRIIAARSSSSAAPSAAPSWFPSSPMFRVPQTSPYGALDSALNNTNLKTLAILPVTSSVPIVEFANHLREALELVGASVALLNTAVVLNQLGKHAFSRLGRLKLMSWLADQEEMHRLVLYVADGGVNNPWTQRCVRQADCIFLVADADDNPAIGEYERLLLGMKTTARKELVLLHAERYVHTPGSTAQWLKNRLWIHAHHHVQMQSTGSKMYSSGARYARKNTLNSLKAQFQKYYSRASSTLVNAGGRKLLPGVVGIVVGGSGSGGAATTPGTAAQTQTHAGLRSDFARLARRLLSRSIGLVLGGGGARGISHVGLIHAFEEAGIPIDMVGGTSIGAFVGGLYARENDHVSVFGRAKQFSGRMSSIWRKLSDLTYPVTSLFTGHEFNRGIWKSFYDTHIEDCWLPYFCVTTNITYSQAEIHRFGYMWRYIRASMSLSGYLPPLCDNGNMLLDGGYLNNLPADVMKSLGADTIIAVDVGMEEDNTPVDYGDSLSGWWVLINRWNPFFSVYYQLAGKPNPLNNIPQMADIQSRLAYVSSVKQLEDAKAIEGCLYMHPQVSQFGTLEFGQFKKIYEAGYVCGKEMVERWREDGTLAKRFGIKSERKGGWGRTGRRASI
ncbi:phosphatidylcholine and lysophosphatidylcholine phospholipase [Quaeritorhiza haematococci]|nr:phosphatidylcholine and lysophosphatidylcholine phospholipase [Quaeritorhiza haematococci]